MSIYRYYCMNCGHHFDKGEVCFDLISMLGLEKNQTIDFIPISGEDLKKIAIQNKIELERGKIAELVISVHDILSNLAVILRQRKKIRNADSLGELTWGQIAERELGFTWRRGDKGARQQDIGDFLDSLEDKLFDQDVEPTDDMRLEDCMIRFWIKPYFFEGTTTIRTIEYSKEGRAPIFKSWRTHHHGIRGYCPQCQKALIADTGQYQQYLIGVLGKQASGKSNLFVAMLNELDENIDKKRVQATDVSRLKERLGLNQITRLADEQYDNLTFATRLNANGYVVPKTDIFGENRYNISVLAEGRAGKAIVSLVDIPGELWNENDHAIDEEILERFPLILFCDAYILCASPDGGNHGLNTCVNLMYGLILGDGRKKIPPLCVAVTKGDLIKEGGSAFQGEDFRNPFISIIQEFDAVSAFIDGSGDWVYKIKDELEHLRFAYDFAAGTKNSGMIDALNVCISKYNDYKGTGEQSPYLSMIAVSALGTAGEPYLVQDPDAPRVPNLPEGFRYGTAADAAADPQTFRKNGVAFAPQRLDAMWDWIFRTIGLTSLAFSYVPSRGESYCDENTVETNASYRIPVRCKLRDGARDLSHERIQGVYRMYVNPSEHDKEILNIEMEGPTRGIFGVPVMKRKTVAIREYLRRNKN